MRIDKKEQEWLVEVEKADNQMGLINIVRDLERVGDQIADEAIVGLILNLDLSALDSVNSEIIAQFVMLQSNLVRTDGRLRVVNANVELKSSFDVVMLDKIIAITYLGLDPDEENDYSEE